MNKKIKFFSNGGFYIVLIVCLCIGGITAVYMSNYNSSSSGKISKDVIKPKQTVVLGTDPVSNKSKVNSAMTSKQQVKSIKDVAKVMNKPKKTSSIKMTKVRNMKNFKLLYPVKGEIIKKFDNKELQYSKTMNQWETHEGIDITSEIGSTVKAAMGGKIVEVIKNDKTLSEFSKDGYGDGIVIDHGNGYITEYLNLADESLKLKKGTTVKAGQIIGTVGDTSLRESVAIEGSHLDFSLLKKSAKSYVAVNPEQFLK